MRVSELERTNAMSLRSSIVGFKFSRCNNSFASNKISFYRKKCKKVKKIHIAPSKSFTLTLKDTQSSLNSARTSQVTTPRDSIDISLNLQKEIVQKIDKAKEELSKVQMRNKELQLKLNATQEQMKMKNKELINHKKEVEFSLITLETKAKELKLIKDQAKYLKASIRSKEQSLSEYKKKAEDNKASIIRIKEYAKELTNLKKALDLKKLRIIKEQKIHRGMADNTKKREDNLNKVLNVLEKKVEDLELRKVRLAEREQRINNADQEDPDLKALIAEMYEDLWTKKREMESKEIKVMFNKIQKELNEIQVNSYPK